MNYQHMRRLFFLTLLSLLLHLSAQSQALQFQATRTHDNGSMGSVLLAAPDQGSVLAGHSALGNTGYLDLVKYDEFRNYVWSVSYQLTDTLLSVTGGCSYGDQGYLFAASVHSGNANTSELLLIRTDTAGNMLWNRRYSIGLRCDLSSLLPVADGGFIAGGTVLTDSTARYEDMLVIRGNEDGNLLWSQSIGSSARESGNSMIRTSDDQYAIAGTTEDANGSSGAFLSKLDTSGNYYWFTRYATGIYDAAYSLVQADNGSYQLAGKGGPTGEDVLLLRTDVNGTPSFARIYQLSFGTYQLNETALGMTGTPDGGFLIGGEVLRPGTLNPWLFLVKFSGNLLTEWFNSYAFSTSRDQRFGSMLQQADGGVLLGGSRRISAAYPWNALTIATDASGISGCLETALNEHDSTVTPIAINLSPVSNTTVPTAYYSQLTAVQPNWTTDSACYTFTNIGQTNTSVETLSFYPQPATQQLSIREPGLLKFPCSYHIFDQVGRSSLQGTLDSIDSTLPLTSLTAGIYQVWLVGSDGTPARASLIIQKP